MINKEPDLEKLLEIIVESIADEDKSIVALYLRKPDSLSEDAKKKAVEALKTLLSKYPELKWPRNLAEELGVGEEEIIRVYKKYKIKKEQEEIQEKQKILETVTFNNQELCKDDYEALKELAKEHFNKTPEQYFNNTTEWNKEIYMEINDKRVKLLVITKQGLKEIPRQINRLTGLIELHLEHNNISKIENLDKLTQLKALELSFNKISKIENLYELSQLEVLYIGINKISKMENLDELTQIMSLNLCSNQISKIENLENLKKLKYLWLAGNPIPEDDPAFTNLYGVRIWF